MKKMFDYFLSFIIAASIFMLVLILFITSYSQASSGTINHKIVQPSYVTLNFVGEGNRIKIEEEKHEEKYILIYENGDQEYLNEVSENVFNKLEVGESFSF